MRIAEYKQIATETYEENILIPAEYDDEGNEIAPERTETVVKERPIMGLVYRDMTPEEIAQAEEEAANMPEPEPTPDERLAEVEQTQADIMDAMIELASMLSE